MSPNNSQKSGVNEPDSGYVYRDNKIKAINGAYDFKPDQEFEVVLKSMPSSRVPDGIVRLGILTRKITPVQNRKRPVQYAINGIDNVQTADVSKELLEAVMWLLKQCSDQLGEQRKHQIGGLLESAGLNSTQSNREKGEYSSKSVHQQLVKDKSSTTCNLSNSTHNKPEQYHKQSGGWSDRPRRCPECGKVGSDFSNRGLCKSCEHSLTGEDRWEGGQTEPNY